MAEYLTVTLVLPSSYAMTPDEQASLKELGWFLIRDSYRPIGGSIFYGISVGLCGYAAYLIQMRQLRGRLAWVILVTGLVCFLLTSINFGGIIATVSIEFATLYKHTAEISAASTENSVLEKNTGLRSAYIIYFLTQYLVLGISDGIVIWRTRVLYPDNPRLFWFPVVCLVASVGCWSASMWQQKGLPGWPSTHILIAGRIMDDVGHTFSLLTNVSTTIYVGARLWSHQKWFLKYLIPSAATHAPVQKKLLVLVETGAFFCLVQMMTLGSLLAIDIIGSTGKTCSSSCIITNWLINRFRYAFAANYSILVLILICSKISSTDTNCSASLSAERLSTVQTDPWPTDEIELIRRRSSS